MNYPIVCLVSLLVGVSSHSALACTGSEDGFNPVNRSTLDADVVFHGEHVVTLSDTDSVVNLVAVKGDKIVFVGDARDWQGKAESTIALGEKALLPGFIDAHGHLSFYASVAGMANVASPPVGPAETMASLRQILKSHIQARELADDEWIVGMGYDDSLLEEGRHPTIEDLDPVSRTHPILLMHVSGHLAAVNSRALALAGINEGSVNPPGGVIRRFPNSQKPNGVLEESATYAVHRFQVPSENPLDDLHKGLQAYAGYGITTAQDGGTSAASIGLFEAASQAKPFPIDVVAFRRVQEKDLLEPGLKVIHSRNYINGFRVGGIKMILDGSPQGKTAYLTEPYEVPPQDKAADYRGYPVMPEKAVDALFAHFIAAETPILAHANGDAAADLFLNALERSLSADHLPDHRTVMIHAQTVREDQLDRFAKMKVIPSYFSAHTFYWGDWHRDSVLGLNRASRISPTASSVRKEVLFTVHNDAPVVPPDMLRLVWATANRLTRSGQILGAAQRISVYEALKAITINAAYQYFEEGKKGSIEVGKQADLVVLSENPLTVSPVDLLDVKVVRTIARGKTVYLSEDN